MKFFTKENLISIADTFITAFLFALFSNADFTSTITLGVILGLLSTASIYAFQKTRPFILSLSLKK